MWKKVPIGLWDYPCFPAPCKACFKWPCPWPSTDGLLATSVYPALEQGLNQLQHRPQRHKQARGVAPRNATVQQFWWLGSVCIACQVGATVLHACHPARLRQCLESLRQQLSVEDFLRFLKSCAIASQVFSSLKLCSCQCVRLWPFNVCMSALPSHGRRCGSRGRVSPQSSPTTLCYCMWLGGKVKWLALLAALRSTIEPRQIGTEGDGKLLCSLTPRSGRVATCSCLTWSSA